MKLKARQQKQRAFLVDLGMAIRNERRRQGLKQKELGARVGTCGPRIGEIERAIVSASVTRIAEIAAALCMPLAELVSQAEGDEDVNRARAFVAAKARRFSPGQARAVAQLILQFEKEGDPDEN